MNKIDFIRKCEIAGEQAYIDGKTRSDFVYEDLFCSGVSAVEAFNAWNTGFSNAMLKKNAPVVQW